MLAIAADFAVIAVAALHLWFLVLEMFLWTKPLGRRTFGLSAERAQQTRSLAANQGLYNGFLAAGLLWSLLADSPTESFRLQTFFLACVTVAGIYGGLTASRSILFVQALPALLGLVVLWGFRVPA